MYEEQVKIHSAGLQLHYEASELRGKIEKEERMEAYKEKARGKNGLRYGKKIGEGLY